MTNFTLNQIFKHSDSILFKEGTEISIMNLDSDEVYFKLKGLTKDIWLAMKSEKSFKELLELTKTISHQPETDCVQFLNQFLSDLSSKKLIKLINAKT